MKNWKVFAALGGALATLGGVIAMTGSASAQPTTTIDTGINPQVLAQSQGNGQVNGNGNVDVALTLNSPNQTGLDQFVSNLYNPSSPDYRHYLSVSQFAAQYGQPQLMVDSLVSYFHSFGIQATVYPGNLNIDLQGSASEFNKAFSVSLENLSYDGANYVGTQQAPTLPAAYAGVVKAAIGLDSLSDYTTHVAHQTQGQGQNHGTTPTGYMPSEVLSRYNAQPLVDAGNTGVGQTIGIATLAAFHPNDAYYYWNYLGLNVNQNRITQIPVDGGSTSPIGWNSGSDETTLDVEQSGALAPGANIDVYEAPNTNAGFVDLFYAVAGADQVQEMSVSWGESEDFINACYANAISLATEQGAAEGISMFAAAGDSGAYDGYGYTLPDGSTDTSLSVDNPADSPYITSAGGTTLPGTQNYGSVSVTVPTERVWAWDYLVPYWQNFGAPSQSAWQADLYPVGGGGGFSQFYATPWYQSGLSRPQSSGTDPHSGVPYKQERSLPDISMNADPQTGYSMYVSFPSIPSAYLYQGWNTFGGTSFVAPQLAGLTALINQADNTQIGFWNPQLYAAAANVHGHTTSPVNDITAGDNWYYNGVSGYDEGTGLGTPNIAQFAADVK